MITCKYILLSSVCMFTLLGCASAQSKAPPQQMPAQVVPVQRSQQPPAQVVPVQPPHKQPEIWRILGIGANSELAIKDARANMRRDVFSRINRWGENMYADAVEMFSMRDKSGLADYLSLASDTIVRDIPATVESFQMNNSWTARSNVNVDELQAMFNKYASRGAKCVQESNRKKYRAWCLGRRN